MEGYDVFKNYNLKLFNQFNPNVNPINTWNYITIAILQLHILTLRIG